ncbi:MULTISPECIES: superoxide dismutase family protein [unclassified Sporolactobacillus]|uniref:superoxide dismutase family protein n=1 Tax=unclassified Sporolactobacillus TaxID=2628533 RepID=UPI0023686F7A|nr:superoxide dismutase family protein [Sporolactobacillus sp. CQH2019]MDD9147318.1 superoxide dismutase family protein [Sporolactobacillus sp. CQH2019]
MNIGKIFYLFCALLALAVVVYENHWGHEVNAKSSQSQKLIVPLIDGKGEELGEAVLTETEKGVSVALQAEGLRPGLHAIHFHEVGSCTPPDFMSAGGHFNPEHKQHGLKNPLGPHAGDMPNIFADSHGKVKTVIFNPRVTLEEGKENSLRDADGSALIIHEAGDDQQTDPSGNAGSRVLCGVIK